MSSTSKIEWTERTWNPVIGCTKVSAGCKHCYAESMAKRLKAMGIKDYIDGFQVKTLPNRLEQPLLRKTPTTYFVNSMSDLFHEDVSASYVQSVFDVMEQAHWHTFQVLTKRSGRMKAMLQDKVIPKNIWLGVTVEDKKHGVPRIQDLAHLNAHIKFLSVEPLLEDIGAINLHGIDWVIVGGESGTGARQMNEEWALSIKDQCISTGTAFFFKQWGAWGTDGIRRSKKANGRVLQGKIWDESPAFA